MHVTLNQLNKWSACSSGYKKVIAAVGNDFDKDSAIKLIDILKHKSSDLSDVFWCIEHMELTPDQERDFRLLACGYAERVLPIFEKECPDDNRPRECIEVAKRYAVGDATEEERAAADAAAAGAAGAAARAAARAAAGAAERKTQEEMLMKLLLRYESCESR